MKAAGARGRSGGRASYGTGGPGPTRSPARGVRRGGVLLLAGLAGLAGGGCHTVPVTGRTSFNAFSIASVGQENQLGRTAFADVVSEAKVIETGPDVDRVRRVMNRLVAVADDPGYEWEVVLLDDPQTVNAFALPGGKMAVYSGILPVCGSDAGLAVVMGHEIGHVVARHGTERMSQQLGIEVAFALFDTGEYEQLARTATALALQLPYSRHHESEADHIGLIYMARGGYDPDEAPAFWERMTAGASGAPPEFLSTHPSHETRIRRLRELLPEAREVWRSSGGIH